MAEEEALGGGLGFCRWTRCCGRRLLIARADCCTSREPRASSRGGGVARQWVGRWEVGGALLEPGAADSTGSVILAAAAQRRQNTLAQIRSSRLVFFCPFCRFLIGPASLAPSHHGAWPKTIWHQARLTKTTGWVGETRPPREAGERPLH